jgi:uncharacterized protein
VATEFLSSPDGLEALDAGGGVVTIRWAYPDDFAKLRIVFDIFASPDPTDAFRTCVASDVAGLEVDVAGFERGGTIYFVALAKRAPLLSLPSRALAFEIARTTTREAPPSPVSVSDTAKPAGLAFPFAVDRLGSISSDGGSARLRGQILQLLLTSPGERVNVPDFGTRLRDLVFDPNNDVLAASTEFMITRALQKYLADEIRVEQVAVSADDAVLHVHIVYLRTSDLQFERVRVGIPLPG